MTIKTIYKVEGDSNEYDSEQEAQIAEIIADTEGLYIERYKIPQLAKAITEKYHLIPIVKTETVVVTQAELDQRELDSYGPSA